MWRPPSNDAIVRMLLRIMCVGLLLASAALIRVPAAAAEDACIDCHKSLREERLSRPAFKIKDDYHLARGLSCHNCHGGDPTRSTIRRRATVLPRGFWANRSGTQSQSSAAGVTAIQTICGRLIHPFGRIRLRNTIPVSMARDCARVIRRSPSVSVVMTCTPYAPSKIRWPGPILQRLPRPAVDATAMLIT